MNDLVMSRASRALLRRWRRLVGRWRQYRPIPRTKADWTLEYEAGRWEYLNQLSEVSHYGVVAGYCNHAGSHISVLDVGCGEGILKDLLCPHRLSRYVGIDYSAEAIGRAASRRDPNSQFIETDADLYTPDAPFDVIVFNECLYYLQQPLELMKKYQAYLVEEGFFIVSMTVIEQSRKLWQLLAKTYAPKDGVMITNQQGYSWIVKAYQPNKQPDGTQRNDRLRGL